MQSTFPLKQRVAVLGLALLLGLIAGCRQSAQPTPTPAADVQLTLEVEPDPPVMGEATLIIRLTDASGAPIDGASISVVGDMAHAGMVPVNGEAGNSVDGEYRVPFEWTMGGDWTVTVTAVLPDGRQITQTFDLEVRADM